MENLSQCFTEERNIWVEPNLSYLIVQQYNNSNSNIQGQLFIQFSEERAKSIFIDKSIASYAVEFILKNKMSYRHTYTHITFFIIPRNAWFRTKKNNWYYKICLVRNLSKSNGSKSGSSFSCNDNADNSIVYKLLIRTCILCLRAPCALSHMYTAAVINNDYYLV